jgi:hypothetical protein
MDSVADEHSRVTIQALYDLVGPRSFGPWMLLTGLVIVAPVVGDIPGVPTTTGLVVLLVAGQLVIGRSHFWLPDWILRRSVPSRKFQKALSWLRKPARFVDRLVHPRLSQFAGPAASRVIAGACAVIALGLPLMEVVPFSANLAGVALVAFGLSLIARDGALAIAAGVFTALTIGVVVYGIL